MTECPPFPPPPPLAVRGGALRPETPADLPFLRALFARLRWDEFAPLPWPDDAKRALLAQQFDLQHRRYAAWPDRAFLIVTLSDGPAGRLYLAEEATAVRIVDIALDAVWRGQGIGTALIFAVQDWAGAGGRGVSLQVDKANRRAASLYRKLGFTVTADAGIAWQMEWRR